MQHMTKFMYAPQPAIQVASRKDSAAAAELEWPIELLRIIAALLVVVAHYLPQATQNLGVARFAYTGVDLFFVITGYVFARNLTGGVGNLWAYSLRRFFRIYPLYVVALLAYVSVRLVNGGQIEHLGLHLLFLHTLESREIAFFYNPTFWSLPPELEFYFALPLLALMVRHSGSVWWLVAAAAALHLWISSLITPGSMAVTTPFLLSVHLPGLLLEFLLGAVAWRMTRKLTGNWQAWVLMVLGVGVWLLLATWLPVSTPSPAMTPAWLQWARLFPNLLAALCFACVMVASVRLLGPLAGWPARWGLWWGSLTYGVYLFHNAALQLLEPLRPALSNWGLITVCLIATVVTSLVLHHAVEIPARALGRKLSQRVTGLPFGAAQLSRTA